MPDPKPRPPIRNALGQFALSAEQVADRLSTSEGRRELHQALTGEAPIDPTKFGDPKYLAGLSAEQIADHWDEIRTASEGAPR